MHLKKNEKSQKNLNDQGGQKSTFIKVKFDDICVAMQ